MNPNPKKSLGRLRRYEADPDPTRLVAVAYQPEFATTDAANRWLTSSLRRIPPHEAETYVLVRLVSGRRVEARQQIRLDETEVDLGPAPVSAPVMKEAP